LQALKTGIQDYIGSKSNWPWVVNCAWHISEARPSMRSAIQTTILRALHEIQSIFPLPKTFEVIDRLIEDEKEALNRLATNFSEYIASQVPQKDDGAPITILTLSNSSTILAAVTNLFKSSSCPKMILTILESRPLLEGLNLAKSLLPLKPPQVTIQIATDASAAYFASQTDLVIIGSDQIDSQTGDVKNKVGSVAAAKFAKRTICVTSTDKLAGTEHEEVEENDRREVTAVWGVDGLDEIVVRNIYFEWVDGEDVDGYITERGVIGRRELLEIYQEREKWHNIWSSR